MYFGTLYGAFKIKARWCDLFSFYFSYSFVCNQWLSLDNEDGQIQRVITASEQKELDSFENKIRENSRVSVMDRHMFLSVFLRPSVTSFNRKQRLSCVVAMLFLAMISNAMFYKQEAAGNQVIFCIFFICFVQYFESWWFGLGVMLL